jgi:hypothetical protein
MEVEEWSHATRPYHKLVEGIGQRFGNWCAPPNEWDLG